MLLPWDTDRWWKGTKERAKASTLFDISAEGGAMDALLHPARTKDGDRITPQYHPRRQLTDVVTTCDNGLLTVQTPDAGVLL